MPVSSKKKPLALANSIGDLNKLAEKDVKIVIKNSVQCRQYCKSLGDIFKKAEAGFQDGDEENSYFLFMRFFHIFEHVKRTYEYQKQKKHYNEIINPQNILKAMERAETLADSLNSRYAQLLEDRNPASSSDGKENIKDSDSVKKKSNETSKRPMQNGDPGKNKNNAAPKNDATVEPSLPDVPDLGDAFDSIPIASKAPKSDPWITPNELYNLLKTIDPKSILIFDTRPPDEFHASRIKHNSVINIHGDLLKPGANVNSIERRLAKPVWEIWIRRIEKDYIIIMDYDSTRENSKQDCAIQILKDAIYKWDSGGNLKSEPRLLESGFHAWMLYYPSLCTDPFYKKSRSLPTTNVPDPKKLLSNLDYPTLPGLGLNDNLGQKKAHTSSNDSLERGAGSGSQEEDLLTKLRRQISSPPDTLPDKTSSMLATAQRMREDVRPRVSSAGSRESLNSRKGDSPLGPLNHPNSDAANPRNQPNTQNRNGSLTDLRNPKATMPGQFSFDSVSAPHTGRQFSNDSNATGSGRSSALSTPSPTGSLMRNIPSNSILNANYPTLSKGASNDDMHGSQQQQQLKQQQQQHTNHHQDKQSQRNTTENYHHIRGGSGSSVDSDLGFNDIQSHTIPKEKSLPRSASNHDRPASPHKEPGPRAAANHSSVSGPTGLPHSQQAHRPDSFSANAAAAQGIHPTTQQPHTMPHQSPQKQYHPNTNLPQSSQPHQPPSGIPGHISGGHLPATQNSAKPQQPSAHHPPQQGPQQQAAGLQQPAVRPQEPTVQPQQPQARPQQPPVRLQQPQARPQQPSARPQQPAVTPQNTQPQHPNVAPIQPTSTNAPSSARPLQPNSLPTATQSNTLPRRVGAGQPHSLDSQNIRPRTTEANAGARLARTDSGKSDPEFITSPGLPHGWEKQVDKRTGRLYYMDHTTKSTHWELPPDFYADRERDAVQKQKRKAPEPPAAKEHPKASMKRSLSTPNLAELEDEKENAKPIRPMIDRSSKPAQPKGQLVDRSTKPLSKSRLQNLSPIYGSKGRNLTGLKNLGNTCYMNSVIQALSSTVPLARYFDSGEYLRHLNPKSMNRRPEEVAKELGFLIKVLWSGQYRSASPVDFKAVIGRFATQFAGTKQQDAHEFLMFFMDGIHEDTNRISKRVPMKEQNNDNVPDKIAAINAWQDYNKNNNSIIVDLFQGQFRSTVMCKTCGKKSVTFDVFSCLPLQLTSKSSCSLDDCIRAFTCPEMIGGNNSWKCSHCKAYREATKTIELWKLPPVIIVQLKRFSSDGIWHNKLQTNVNFPISDVDMNRYLASPPSDVNRYNLYSTVNHYGSFECGHYTSFCCQNQNKWYCFDDNSVNEMDRSKVRTSAAYLLFYTAVDFRAYLEK